MKSDMAKTEEEHRDEPGTLRQTVSEAYDLKKRLAELEASYADLHKSYEARTRACNRK